MSKFKQGDRVRHTFDPWTATVLAVHDSYYWVQDDGADDEPYTEPVEKFDGLYEPIPEPFLPDGKDRYYNVHPHGSVGPAHPTLAAAERAYYGPNDRKLGIIRIDGQTGALSWAQGGPTAEHSQKGNEAFIEAALHYVEAYDAYDGRMTPANADRMYRARAAFYQLGRALSDNAVQGLS